MSARWPRVALFVLEALPNARAVRRFVADHAGDIVFVGLSNAERPSTGGLTGQVRRHLARSGPGILPYLAINFGLPDLLAPLAPFAQRLSGRAPPASATPLAQLCRERSLPVMTIDDVNADAVRSALAAHGAEILVTFHFDQILSEPTLTCVPLGGINVHPSLLPRHRGPVPTIHAAAEGGDAYGVTVHRLAVEIDAGAILAQEAVALPTAVTATRAAMLLHESGRRLLEHALDDIAVQGRVPEGRVVPTLPYRGFPDRAQLAAMRLAGVRLTDRRDLQDALTLSSGGGSSD